MKKILFLTVFVFLGCTTEVDTTEPVEDNPIMIDLAGHWKSQCLSENADSYRLSLKIGDDYVTTTEVYFNGDTECGYRSQALKIHHTYAAGGAALLEEPLYAKSLDLKLMWSSAISIHTDQIADWNQRQVCGHNDWKVGEAKSITGRSCEWDAGVPTLYRPTGTMLYDIYSIRGNPKVLRIGNSPSGTVRPTSYDDRLQFFFFGPI